MALSTISIQNVVNLCQTQVDLLPLAGVGGFSNEPALSLANDTLQELLMAPYDWRFNRVEMNMLVTSPFRQDYKFAGATFFNLNSGGAGIDLASNTALSISGSVVTIKLLETYRGAVGDVCYITGTGSNYDSTFTDTGAASSWGGNTYTVTNISGLTVTATLTGSASGTSGAPGITNFGWGTAATMVMMSDTSSPQASRILEMVQSLQPTSQSSNPEYVAVMTDNGSGVLTIRFRNVPGTVTWGAKLVYQAKAILKTALIGATVGDWSPFPDEYSFVYRQMFLARCYRYINSPRSEVEQQKAQQAIAKALGGVNRETEDLHVYPQASLMGTEWGSYGFWF